MTTIQTGTLRIVPVTDEILITNTLRHPRIYPNIIDDSCPPAEEFHAFPNPGYQFLGAYVDFRYIGVFMVHPHNCVMYEVHTCLLPESWGLWSTEAGIAVIAWMFENTQCQRLITSVPAGNSLALRLAKRCGMEEYGVNTRSLLRNGVLLDQTLLGINKETQCPQQSH